MLDAGTTYALVTCAQPTSLIGMVYVVFSRRSIRNFQKQKRISRWKSFKLRVAMVCN